MNPYAIPPMVGSIICLVLGLYVIYKNPKNSLNRVFLLLMLFCTVWALGIVGYRLVPQEPSQALTWINIMYTAQAFIGPAILHFAIIFTKKEKMPLGKWIYPILYGIGILFVYFVWATKLFITDVRKIPGGWYGESGPVVIWFLTYLYICMLIAIILLSLAYIRAKSPIEKKRLFYLLVCIPAIIIGGVLLTYIPILFGYHISSLNSSFLIVGAIVIAYVIPKYKVLFIEPSAEELITVPQKYTLEKSLSYVVREEKLDKSYEIFYDQVTHGAQGLCITKLQPERIRERYGIAKTPVVWLTFKDVGNAISPKDVASIKSVMSDFVGKAEKPVILLDCFDQIMLANGFEKAESLLREVKDICRKNNANLLVSINPEIFEEKQMAAIEKELEEVKV